MLRQKIKLTLGLFDFRRDHSRRTPSRRSMILQRKKNKEFNKTNSNKDKEKRKERTHAMLSGSVAQAPTALVTFTKRAWFVLVSRFTSEGMPPALRMVVLLAGICAHSPKAPTTLIKTYAWKKHICLKEGRSIHNALRKRMPVQV